MAKKSKKKAVKKKVAKKQKPVTRAVRSSIGITPLHDRVVIRPFGEHELGTTTASGIIIPETVDRERPERGTVVAVGEGKIVDGKLVKPYVAPGDVVVFSKYGYDEVTVSGVSYVILKEESILARIPR